MQPQDRTHRHTTAFPFHRLEAYPIHQHDNRKHILQEWGNSILVFSDSDKMVVVHNAALQSTTEEEIYVRSEMIQNTLHITLSKLHPTSLRIKSNLQVRQAFLMRLAIHRSVPLVFSHAWLFPVLYLHSTVRPFESSQVLFAIWKRHHVAFDNQYQFGQASVVHVRASLTSTTAHLPRLTQKIRQKNDKWKLISTRKIVSISRCSQSGRRLSLKISSTLRSLQTDYLTECANFVIFKKPSTNSKIKFKIFTFSHMVSRISIMPVLLIKSGKSKGGLSKPRLPAKYFLLAFQCRGTGTVFLYAFKVTRRWGSREVTSAHSTTSGRVVTYYIHNNM